MTLNQDKPFPPSTKNRWKDAAQKELKGEDPFQKLSLFEGGIAIRPYYDASDIAQTKIDQLVPSNNPYLGPRAWYNLPSVKINKESAANKIALEHLNMGADGVLFQIQDKVSLPKLLEGMELPYCATFFLVDSGQSALAHEFAQYVQTKQYNTKEIAGGLFWDTPPTAPVALINLFQGWDKFFPVGLTAQQGDSKTQLSNLLAAAVQQIESAANSKASLNAILSSFAFSFSLGPDFFPEIAKLKAFRRLWLQVCKAYDANYKLMENTFIHAVSPVWINESFEPNGNMLKSTTAAIAAITGGCNGLTVEPEGEGQSFKTRIARNVSNILREESYLNRTADPTAGSYYLESLIDELAQASWSEFQKPIK